MGRRGAIGLLLLCSSIPAAAQQSPPALVELPRPPDEKQDAAKQHFLRGLELFNANDFQRAITEFNASYAARPVAAVLYNIARAHEGLGEYLEAVDAMEHFLRDAVAANPPLTPEKLQEASALLADWRPRLAYLLIVPDVRIARVLVDGKEISPGVVAPSVDESSASGEPRIGLRVRRGQHLVEVSAVGYQQERQSVEVNTGQTLRLDVHLRTAMAHLQIVAEPASANIWLDDVNRGASPFDAEIASGRHTLEVKCVGFAPHVSALNLDGGERQSLDITLQRAAAAESHWYKKWYFWSTVALVVGGGVAVVLATTQQPEPYLGTLSPGIVRIGN